MSKLIQLLVTTALAFACQGLLAAELHDAPSGDDANPSKKDKPFATQDSCGSGAGLPLRKEWQERQQRVNQWYAPARFGFTSVRLKFMQTR